ncbi:universal stress protein [Halorubrum ezzemoulense]|uniref:universal stress protein n=1 Tax=Halorubrum ezzemoulense TaxID=337243 RepID=UPI00232E079A|nr:HPP family protein [Halorubrum ezzemoulense]MDB9252043.1 HPP family protein [Halorubrum ezzemoulense]MDB9254677.1 HPP family protein [Halorubrum ezzemoulense]MDB9275388.1 HPP family protein [Halorubrum ezzemoulense]
MLDRLRAKLGAARRRARRIERREFAELRQWAEDTSNLLHLTTLLLVPMLIALVTQITNLTDLSFLLFPPLASGAYTLFSDPQGQYSSPRTFVGGLVAGALAGWAALELSLLGVGGVSTGAISPLSAGLSIMLCGGLTWLASVEEPAAFSTALLVLVSARGDAVLVFGTTVDPAAAYVVAVAVSGSLVAGAFTVWRTRFYEERARYLYGTTQADDHVLVPMRGETSEATALFGARLAAAHDAGKVVLLDIVDDAEMAVAERAVSADHGAATPGDLPDSVRASFDGDFEEEVSDRAAAAAVERLEPHAAEIRARFDVPCEVVVAADGDPARVAVETARATNSDLIVTPYETEDGLLSPFAREVFAGPLDAVAFRSTTGVHTWRRVLVLVARPGDSAHAMIDFAERLAGESGGVSVCTCIDAESERRRAETKLANLVETTTGPVETRVARSEVTAFLGANADAYDLVLMGSSGDRSAASRLVSPPTFERIQDVQCDVAIVDRGNADHEVRVLREG